jgi:hypothetical protein
MCLAASNIWFCMVAGAWVTRALLLGDSMLQQSIARQAVHSCQPQSTGTEMCSAGCCLRTYRCILYYPVLP